MNLLKKVKSDSELKEKEIANRLSGIRKRLFTERQKRIKPGVDNKILTNWNALMLNSFILAAGSTGKESYKRAAIKNADYIWNNCFNEEVLFHISTNSILKVNGNLDDYSFCADSFFNMYELTFDERWIKRAAKFIDIIFDEFFDEKHGDFFFTSSKINDILLRTKDIYDNALPAATSVTIDVLIRASKYLNKPEYEDIALKYLNKVHDMVIKNPLSFSYLLMNAFYLNNNPKESAIIFRDEVARETVSKRIYNNFIKNSVIMGRISDQLTNLELLKDKTVHDSLAMFYVCSNFTCRQPVSSFEEFIEELNK